MSEDKHVETERGFGTGLRAQLAKRQEETSEAAEARQEPITAMVGLAGIAGVLGTPVARHLLNDPSVSTSLIPVALSRYTGIVAPRCSYGP